MKYVLDLPQNIQGKEVDGITDAAKLATRGMGFFTVGNGNILQLDNGNGHITL